VTGTTVTERETGMVVIVTALETEDGMDLRERDSRHPLHLVGRGKVVGEIVVDPEV